MKLKIVFLLSLLFIYSCKTEETEPVRIEGGKGGNYNLAIFPKVGKKGVSGKVYIKYGSNKPFNDTKMANDSNSTMVEPGYGPHVHFFELTAGYYSIKTTAREGSDQYTHDTVINIENGQAISTDINIFLK